MPEPTDQQLREYAEKLPDIYREILAVFPAASPFRRTGDGLTGETIEEYVTDKNPDIRADDVFEALTNLVNQQFLDCSHNIIFQPSPIGERLITIVTGRAPRKIPIPDLPAPTWG